MGRPPIGKRAMTATERQRRWRAKSRANKPAPKPAARTLKQLQTRVRQLEADHAALCAAMGKLLHAIVQGRADRSKRARLVFEANVREFRAELARLRSVRDLVSRPKTRLDKGLDGRRFMVTVTGYRRRMFWLLDPDSNEVVGPLVPAHTRAVKAPTGNRAKARRGKGSRASAR